MQCANNLKQIGLALHNFENANNCLPYTMPSAFNQGAGRGWMPLILPYVEQNNLANQFKYDLNWSDPANAAIIKTPIKSFVCPSAPNEFQHSQHRHLWRGAVVVPRRGHDGLPGIQGIASQSQEHGLDRSGAGTAGVWGDWRYGRG